MIERLLARFAINSSRVHLLGANERFAREIPPGSLVLDAAAGAQPYRALFSHTQYESADFEMIDKEYARSTYVCDLRSIPVEPGRFEFVIFNQAMEHMSDPLQVLRELNRVMKPGGRMITTAPFFYEEHEAPYDFYRYTQFGHRYLFNEAGFDVERIEWLEGYTGTLAYQLHRAALYLPRRLVFYPVRLIFALLAIWFYRLDVKRPIRSVGYPKNYVVIARKRLPATDRPAPL